MNTRQPTPSSQLTAFLSRFPPDIITQAKRCMPKLRRAFPGCFQIVYNYSGSVVVSFAMSDRGYEGIVAIAISPRGILLYFDKSVPDPKGLLKGAGTKVRSVAIKAASELDRGDVNALIKAAKKHSGISFPRKRPSQMIIKSASKKRGARKTRA